jgi:hypothetical protein
MMQSHLKLTSPRKTLAVLLVLSGVAGLIAPTSGVSASAAGRYAAVAPAAVHENQSVSTKPLRLAQAAAPAQTTENAAVGSVATVSGTSNVTRGDKQLKLATGNEIFKGDVLQTAANGALGVTFDDETTLTLGASTQVSINDYVYQKTDKNAAVFNVARGTLAFVAGQVAKTGDMKIVTPTAALGIRGTTGVVDVPVDQSGAPGETKVKLYQDQGGTTGRIEVFDNAGARLGLLSRASTGFAVRLDQALSRSFGQPRYAGAIFAIAPQELARDRSQVRALFSVHAVGRQIINLRRSGSVIPPGLQRTPNLRNVPGLPGQRGQPALQRQNLRQRPNLQRVPNLQQTPTVPQVPGLRAPNLRLAPGLQRLPRLPLQQGQQKNPAKGRNNQQQQQQLR